MRIEFIEETNLALRKTRDGRTIKHRRFRKDEVCEVEFLGEDSDLDFIDFRFEDGLCAIRVPRFAVTLTP